MPETTGAHTFSVSSDNGFRLWVDGALVIDHWIDDWDKEQTSEPVQLTAGRAHDIKVEYFEHYGGSNFHLRWTRPAAPRKRCPGRRSASRTASTTTAPSPPPSSPPDARSSWTSPSRSPHRPPDSPTTSTR